MAATFEVLGVTDTLDPKYDKYTDAFKSAGESFVEAYNIFQDVDFASKKGWKLDQEKDDGITVHSKSFPFGQLYALTAILDAPVDTVYDETITKFENIPQWSSNIVMAKVVAQLSENVDIVHYANPDVLIVKSRDFVTTRMYRKVDDTYYIAAKSAEIDICKETKDRVRGKLHLGCGKMSPYKDGKTKIEYLLSIDLRGFIPKAVVNAVMGKLIVNDVVETSKHVSKK